MSDNPTLDRWRRKREKAEAAFENAEKSIKQHIAESMKNPETLKNLARDELDARRNTSRQQNDINGYGFAGVANDITGYEKLPWENDSEYGHRKAIMMEMMKEHSE